MRSAAVGAIRGGLPLCGSAGGTPEGAAGAARRSLTGLGGKPRKSCATSTWRT